MKRDLKSANANSVIVVYVVDDCLTNVFKKSRPKRTKMAELRYFEIGCKKLHFEKTDFEIYETDFWDFWDKINFETFYVQNYSQKVCSRSILNHKTPFWGLFYTKKALFLHLCHLFMGITSSGVFIFYLHSTTKTKISIHQLLYFGDMFLNGISLDGCKKPRNGHFDLNSVFSLSYKISFADLRSLSWLA